MTLNDKDYERINEAANKAARALEELAERIRPIIEELAEMMSSDNEELKQKLIVEAAKLAVKDAQAKEITNDNNNDIN